MNRLLRLLLTRKVTLLVFSDGDVFVDGTAAAGDALCEKPPGVSLELHPVRTWRWSRAA